MTQTYNPKLGDANRYANATRFNQDLADKINQEALIIVSIGEILLKKVQENPQARYSHDPLTEGRHIGDFLRDNYKKIYDLYGVACTNTLEHISSVPKEIVPFLNGIDGVLN